jgi:acetyltransferase-like isoleucine patch superfamily enzyme
MKGIPFAKMLLIGFLPNFLKVIYYRIRGAKVGKKVRFGVFSLVTADEFEIGDYSRIGAFSFVNAKEVRIGKRVHVKALVAIDTGFVEIGDDSVIMEQVVVGGMLTPRSRISIGKRVKVFSFSFLNPTEPLIIEDDVGIGGASHIFTHGSWQSQLDGYPIAFGPVTLKKGVWLPWRVFIMPGVTVGEHSTIGANSVITRDIPPRSLAVGSPAKAIKTGEEYVRKHTEEEKHQMVVDMMREYARFLDFIGYPACEEKDRSSFCISVPRRSGYRRVQYWRAAPGGSVPERAVVISLQPMSAEARKAVSSHRGAWFDIGSAECSFSEDPLWAETRNFLSRYGIRFEVLA